MNRDLCVAAVMTTSAVGELATNVANVGRWVEKAARQGVEVVCFPELSLTGYSTQPDALRPYAQSIPGPLTYQLESLARENNITILVGLAEAGEQGRLYASHVVVAPQSPCRVYRKIHLASPEKGLFTPGDLMPVFDLDGVRIGIQLCYDAHFPEMSTAMALDGADIIFIPHASPRGLPEDKLTSWMRHLPARAFDNGVFIVACNQVGSNGRGLEFPGVVLAFGPNGKILAQAATPREEMVVVQLQCAQLEVLHNHPLAYFLPHRRGDLYGQDK